MSLLSNKKDCGLCAVMGSLPSGAQLHILISDVLVGKGRPAAEFWLCKSSMSAQCTADKTEKSCDRFC